MKNRLKEENTGLKDRSRDKTDYCNSLGKTCGNLNYGGSYGYDEKLSVWG